MTPTEATDVTNDALRDTYVTHTGFGDEEDHAPWNPYDPPVHYRRRGIVYTEISKPRWACEQNCSFSSFRDMSDWCMGFVFESRCTLSQVIVTPGENKQGVDVFDMNNCPDEGTCKYFGAGFLEDDMYEMNYTFYEENAGSGSYYNLALMESVVERKKFKSCTVTLGFAGELYDGEYSKMMCSGDTVFQVPDNLALMES